MKAETGYFGPTIEYVEHEGVLLAIIIPHNYKKDGIEFLTKPEYSQQLGIMKRPSGYVIAPHIHTAVPREVSYTQEVLFIRKGRVAVDFYDESGSYLSNRTLETGDVILLARGGHGFLMLEESEIIEVKQGPYTENDKRRF
jgi:hypothetical protein